jgi:hypothetical protein
MGGARQDGPKGLPFHLPDYLQLVNWTGQAVREDKRGATCEDLPPILERLGVDGPVRLRLATEFESSFYTWVGQAEHVHSASVTTRLGAPAPSGCCFPADSSFHLPANDPIAPRPRARRKPLG